MRFRLGYVADPLVGHEYLKGRLCIPYLTPAGVTELKFRKVDDGENGPKYLYASGSKADRIYNAHALFDDRDYVCICEGEIDAITAEQAGLPSVGIPGVDNWKPFFSRVFAGYDRVLILADADDQHGQGENFAHALGDYIPNSRVVLMPEGEDVNSFYQAEGAEALRRKAGIE